MESEQTPESQKPAVVGLGLTDLLAESSLSSALKVLKNNVDVKREVSDEVLLRWSPSGTSEWRIDFAGLAQGLQQGTGGITGRDGCHTQGRSHSRACSTAQPAFSIDTRTR